MLGQIITGIGLASQSPTHGVKMLSIRAQEDSEGLRTLDGLQV